MNRKRKEDSAKVKNKNDAGNNLYYSNV